jgi:putative transposase
MDREPAPAKTACCARSEMAGTRSAERQIPESKNELTPAPLNIAMVQHPKYEDSEKKDKATPAPLNTAKVRHPLRRYYGRGHLHFITFSCYRRQQLLCTGRARELFLKLLDEVRARYGFRLVGYVVMPEHVHLLISEPGKGTPSKALQVLKQRVSRAMRRKRRRSGAGQMVLPFARAGGDGAHFWQRRFYDFNVWSAKKVTEKLNYMHLNPVQRKLVKHPKDWPWSRWAHYERGAEGLLRVDGEEGFSTRKGAS